MKLETKYPLTILARFPTPPGEGNGLPHYLEEMTLAIKNNKNIVIRLVAVCLELKDSLPKLERKILTRNYSVLCKQSPETQIS